jgi:hypothetical protein
VTWGAGVSAGFTAPTGGIEFVLSIRALNSQNKNMFQRRIMGLISYYSGSTSDLFAEKNILIKDIPEITDEEKENIIKLAEENNVVDEEENLLKTRLYLINSKIDIILSNIKLNNLIVESKKDEIIKQILELENKSINANSTILLDILKELNEKFCTFTNVQDFTDDNIFNNRQYLKGFCIGWKNGNEHSFNLNKNDRYYLKYLSIFEDN